MQFCETSAKNDVNVEQAFMMLAADIKAKKDGGNLGLELEAENANVSRGSGRWFSSLCARFCGKSNVDG